MLFIAKNVFFYIGIIFIKRKLLTKKKNKFYITQFFINYDINLYI